MTIPSQRTNAVLNARDFLTRLTSPYVENGIKGVKREVREEARRVLRHFPSLIDIAQASDRCPDVFESPSGWPVEQARIEEKPKWLDEGPVWVDPPSGWRYGFPKLWDRKGTCQDWMIANGYPEHLAKKGLPVRFIQATEGP